jgi:hypothetical protein
VRRTFYVLAVAMGTPACSLLTDFGGLSGGAANDAGDSTAIDRDAATTVGDAPVDALDAGVPSDDDAAGDGEGGPACGFPGPTIGLLAYYPFEEGSGTSVHDCGPHHVDGTIINQVAGTWTTGARGGAVRVATPNGCVDLGTAPALNAATMTASMWISVVAAPASGSTGYILGRAANADVAGWRVGVRSSGAVGWESSASGTSYFVDSPAAVSLNVWHHVAVTFAPDDTVKVFVDGASVTTTAAVPPIVPVSVSMRIGCRSDNANYFRGAVDEVRLYDRVLTPAEITSLATP